MKKFELRLIMRPNNEFEIKSFNVIESDDLVQLLAQFQILLVKLMRDIHEAELNRIRMVNDDIPF